MKYYLYYLFFTGICCCGLQAQTTTWQMELPDTYVFQLSETEARDLTFYPNTRDRFVGEVLKRSCYTTFRETWDNAPETGYFLLIRVQANRMYYSLRTFVPYEVVQVPTYNGFTVKIIDESGHLRSDATVTYREAYSPQDRIVPYNSREKTYSRSLYRRLNCLTVELEGVRSFFRGNNSGQESGPLAKTEEWEGWFYPTMDWDSIASYRQLPFYRFLYPARDAWFIHTEVAPGDITQFAPFVVAPGGYVEEVKVIECDDVPVWFSWAEHARHYSFPVDPDTSHTITLRTAGNSFLIHTDSGFFKPGMKTIFSIHRDNSQVSNRGDQYEWQVRRENNTFTSGEKAHYRKYLSLVPVHNNALYTYLKQGETEIPVYRHQPGKKSPAYVLMGPITPGITTWQDGFEYEHEGGYQYEYKKGIVYKTETNVVPGLIEAATLEWPYERLHDFVKKH